MNSSVDIRRNLINNFIAEILPTIKEKCQVFASVTGGTYKSWNDTSHMIDYGGESIRIVIRSTDIYSTSLGTYVWITMSACYSNDTNIIKRKIEKKGSNYTANQWIKFDKGLLDTKRQLDHITKQRAILEKESDIREEQEEELTTFLKENNLNSSSLSFALYGVGNIRITTHLKFDNLDEIKTKLSYLLTKQS